MNTAMGSRTGVIVGFDMASTAGRRILWRVEIRMRIRVRMKREEKC